MLPSQIAAIVENDGLRFYCAGPGCPNPEIHYWDKVLLHDPETGRIYGSQECLARDLGYEDADALRAKHGSKELDRYVIPRERAVELFRQGEIAEECATEISNA